MSWFKVVFRHKLWIVPLKTRTQTSSGFRRFFIRPSPQHVVGVHIHHGSVVLCYMEGKLKGGLGRAQSPMLHSCIQMDQRELQLKYLSMDKGKTENKIQFE